MSVFIVGVIVFISTLILQMYAKTSLSWMSDSYIMQDGLDNACRDYLLLQKTKLSCVCDRKL